MIKKSLRCLKNILTPTYVAKPGQLPPSWIPYKDYIEIHPTALIAPSATVQFYNLPKTPRPMLKIGPMSHIFGHFAFLRETAEIRVGERCQIGASHLISGTSINIKDDVIVSWGCHFIDTDNHAINWNERKNDTIECYNDYLRNPKNMVSTRKWYGVSFLPIVINSKSWIGFNTIILKDVELGEEVLVGAGSVVTKSFRQRGSTIAGNPAKIVK